MDQPRRLGALDAVLALLARVTDPAERMRAIALVAAELEQHADRFRDLRRTTALELRATGMTWREIGELLGSTAQAAHQIVNPTPTTNRKQLTR